MGSPILPWEQTVEERMMEGYHHLTDSSQDKEVDVVRLKKYGCGLRISLVVSCLSWQGLFLSLLGFAASIFVLLLPRSYTSSGTYPGASSYTSWELSSGFFPFSFSSPPTT